ncbi:MAG: hypothetical protein A2043_08720 [Candidatus Schekmanbacteria bacterium GWA2_38_9]|uniref:Glycosyl transferase family 1 domain-containing protein n=1 Tax=Candidatus Schekmanbacteria bacterium RIFCSPLOWO2_12_FULL_38_15 TaxID=1817883 RepID=A0A1F7SKA3_9BACT|nr:MAG: hypothetical protein A2043_08720 [Candidatus Schekmanbacteria bacterium GWA2_38_9]OGL51249.1 MAG: hypothetical protein A3H37_10570 [Candidatus Schekmanbacteria bacterium RIFCSPLOWO2_02_FULL_38_14]OGL54200.1 MAG: hypothetical protein A3G31_05410 [Candidatus Schekmanbacteria bacterium RIFCSPLOWO2_12_FULL_38_15]
MRIVLIGLTHPFRGGISHYSTLSFNSLSKKHDVKFLSFRRQYPELLFPGKTQKDISLKPLKAESHAIIDSLNPFSWIKVIKEIKDFKPQITIFNWWTPFFGPCYSFISFFIKKFTKIIFIVHDLIPPEKSITDNIFSKLAFYNASWFILHSKKDEEGLKLIKKDAKLKVIPHPIYSVFSDIYSNNGHKNLKEYFGLKPTDKLILFFGYVREYKGLKYLIKSMPEILKEIKDCYLLIAGEFYEDENKYKKLIEETGVTQNIRIINQYIPNEEVGSYFTSSDVVVLPYTQISQSGVIQIAYGFRKPLISTKIGGIPDVVKDGVTGILVPPRDEKALAEGVIKFFKEEKSKSFETNIGSEISRFSWNRLIEAVEEIGEDSSGLS